MSFAHQAIGWIEEENDFRFELVETRLKKSFPNSQLSRQNNKLSVSINDWEARIYFADGPQVTQEAQEFGQHFPNCLRLSEIARCRKRIEIICPEESSDMEHFNDFLFVCHALEFEGVIIVDLASGNLLSG